MTRLARLLGTCALATMLAVTACATDDGGDLAQDPTTTTVTQDDDAAVDERAEVDDEAAAGADAPPRPSPGCDAPDTQQVVAERVDIAVGGVERNYLVTAPATSAEAPLPLVVDLHGLMEGAEIHARHSGLGEFGLERDFVTVFPHGTGEPVAWGIEPGPDNPDLEYLDAVLDRVGSRFCIDEARTYATGLSNGAMMTSVLICERADRFAAAAPVGGVMAPEPCDQERPVPILATHGTADPILLFNGGVGDLTTFLGDEAGNMNAATSTTEAPADLDGEGYPETMAAWADRNGCESEPEDERIGESVVHRVYDCPAGADVEFHIVEDGGHTWPGSEFSVSIESITGPTTFEIDWNELSWEFFQRFALT